MPLSEAQSAVKLNLLCGKKMRRARSLLDLVDVDIGQERQHFHDGPC